MQYPENMLEFTPEIGELSRYLTELKMMDALDSVDSKQVAKIFSKIIAKIDPASDSLAEGIADIFVFNLNNLYQTIGNNLATENKAMLATVVGFTFKSVLQEIVNHEPTVH